VPIIASAAAKASFVIACWPDGHSAAIPSLTVSKYEALARAVYGSPGTCWEGMCEGSKHALVIRQRVDRRLLLCLFEQSRQILQVNLGSFGDIDDEARQQDLKHPAVIAGLQMMLPIAELYAAGKLQRKELTKARDNAMAGLTLHPLKPIAMRRPASASACASASTASASTASASTAPGTYTGLGDIFAAADETVAIKRPAAAVTVATKRPAAERPPDDYEMGKKRDRSDEYDEMGEMPEGMPSGEEDTADASDA
jgi:hypothetical protein